MKKYTSFDEIDRDLKYLRLKSQLDLEQIKMEYHYTKSTFKETLAPMNLIKNAVGAVVKKAVLLKGVSKLVGLVTRR